MGDAMIRSILSLLWESYLADLDRYLRLKAQQSIYAILLGKKLTPFQALCAFIWLRRPSCPEQHRRGFNRWPVLKPVKVQ
jgi:hypothetical protein